MTTQNIFDLVDTWNNGATTFTAVKMNVTDTASAAASLLMDLQIGSVSAFNVSKGGSLKLGLNTSGTNVAASNVVISGPQGTGSGAGGSIVFQVAPLGGSGASQNGLVTFLEATSARAFNLYNTTDVTTNFERGVIKWASNVLRIGTEKGGTGTARALEFQTDGTTRLTIASTGAATFAGNVYTSGFFWVNTNSGFIALGTGADLYLNRVGAGIVKVFGSGGTGPGVVATNATVVGSLPAAATAGAGAFAFVTDANTTMAAGIGTTVAGGGANAVPVYSDGTNWLVG